MNPTKATTHVRALDFISPVIGDLLFYELVPVEKTKQDATLAYGSAHPKPSEYPNHKLVAIKPHVDQNNVGMERYYYAATRASQESYNYEVHEGREDEFPWLMQYWVILRADFTGCAMTSGITAPAAFGRTWTRVGAECLRIGDETLDALFVVLRVYYTDLTVVLTSYEPLEGNCGSTAITRQLTATSGAPSASTGLVRYTKTEVKAGLWLLTTRTMTITGSFVSYEEDEETGDIITVTRALTTTSGAHTRVAGKDIQKVEMTCGLWLVTTRDIGTPTGYTVPGSYMWGRPALLTAIDIDIATNASDVGSINITPTIRAGREEHHAGEMVVDFLTAPGSPSTLYQVEPNDLVYSGYTFGLSIHNVLNDAGSITATFPADDAVWPSLVETLTINASSPTKTAYLADVGSLKLVAEKVVKWRFYSLWRRERLYIKLK